MRKCSFFVTYAGSQLTFMTQHEKVIIFRYERGFTTDLLDVQIAATKANKQCPGAAMTLAQRAKIV